MYVCIQQEKTLQHRNPYKIANFIKWGGKKKISNEPKQHFTNREESKFGGTVCD